MIELDALIRHFGPHRALDGLTCRVPTGGVVGLVGRNGAGKTTALRVLSGQLLPDAGDARVQGVSVLERPRAVKRRLGFLPESPPLYDEMTVRAYLRFACRLRGQAARRAEARVAEVMAQTGLAEVAGRRIGGLSRGYRQRVGIAQAVVHEPPVVVLDEPMAGLDPVQTVRMRDIIAALRGRHTVLFSTNILSEVTAMCDEVVLVDRGRLVAQGSEAALRQRLWQQRRLSLLLGGDEAAVRRALGTPPGTRFTLAAEGDGLWRARVETGEDCRAELSRACVEAGLALLELREEGGGLERLFLELVREPSRGAA